MGLEEIIDDTSSCLGDLVDSLRTTVTFKIKMVCPLFFNIQH
jgi:hypothetical protein